MHSLTDCSQKSSELETVCARAGISEAIKYYFWANQFVLLQSFSWRVTKEVWSSKAKLDKMEETRWGWNKLSRVIYVYPASGQCAFLVLTSTAQHLPLHKSIQTASSKQGPRGISPYADGKKWGKPLRDNLSFLPKRFPRMQTSHALDSNVLKCCYVN